MNPFESALKKADDVIFATFGNASIKCHDVTYRGILDFPLSVKKLKKDAGEIADCDFKLCMRTDEVKQAQITKRSPLDITLDSGEQLNLYVLNRPEHDGDGLSEMQLGVSNGSSGRIDIQY